MPALSPIFRCNDQSALIHNYVTNHDPPPGAWSRQSEVQSPLGRVTFPLVITVNRGDVYTRDGKRNVVVQMLDVHEWVPWGYHGRNDTIRVRRSIGRDVWHTRVDVGGGRNRRALLLLELVPGAGMNASNPSGLKIAYQRTMWGVRIRWEDRFEMHLQLAGKGCRINISHAAALLRRRFAGFDDVKLHPPQQQWIDISQNASGWARNSRAHSRSRSLSADRGG
jgi:hypothetical protein